MLFFVAAPIGIIPMILGYYPQISDIGSGLIFGGFITGSMGYGIYWNHIPAP